MHEPDPTVQDLVAEPDIIEQIFDFNEQVIGTDDVELNPLTEKQFRWTEKFVLEELTEFAEAFQQQDIVGMVDAIGDLIYGAMGTFKKMGLSREQVRQAFAAIHAANMTKKRGDKGRGLDEDAVKPADFVPPEQVIASILFKG
jgi:predicted HAD superfamily Cof-like phosphohydrolase